MQIIATVPDVLCLSVAQGVLDLTVDWLHLSDCEAVLDMQWTEGERPFASYCEISVLPMDGHLSAARVRLLLQQNESTTPVQFTFVSCWTSRTLVLSPNGCMDNASSSHPWVVRWFCGDAALLALSRVFRPIQNM